MSNVILILGPSGTGKSTSLRNLDPETTFIINVLKKRLPFKGSSSIYSEDKGNYKETDKAATIVKYIEAISERRPEIKTLVIDDSTFIMNNEYMRRAHEKKFEKFIDMGSDMFNVMEASGSCRADLMIYVLCHVEYSPDGMVIPRTVGKMTSDYVGLGERVTIALHSCVINGEYKFLTQHNGQMYAKSDLGMFEDLHIDNDLVAVSKTINEFIGE